MKDRRGGESGRPTEFNPEWLKSTERVVRLIESIFHCKVEFSSLSRFLDELSIGRFHSHDLSFLESTHATATRFIRGIDAGVCAIPLRLRSQLHPAPLIVGMAVVEGLAAHTEERVEQLTEFLQLAIEARIDAFERLLDIEHFEAQQRSEAQRKIESQQQLTLTESDSNSRIIHLGQHRAKLLETDEQSDDFAPDDLEADALSSTADQPSRFDVDLAATTSEGLQLVKPLILYARDVEFPIHKVALEIFDKSNLWGFVHLSDLDPNILSIPGAFEALGPSCVYVPSLSVLSIEQQRRLAEIYREPAKSDRPSLVIGTSMDVSDSLGTGTLLKELLDESSVVDLCPLSVPRDATSRYRMRVAVERVEAQLRFDSPDLSLQIGQLIQLRKWNREDGSTFH